jgi:hypothetical protein
MTAFTFASSSESTESDEPPHPAKHKAAEPDLVEDLADALLVPPHPAKHKAAELERNMRRETVIVLPKV